jgi:hypothetical protein
MFRKLLLIGVLFISFWALLGANAYAYPAWATGGWGAWPNCVCFWSDWKGVSNPDQKPSDVIYTMSNMEIQVYYLNPGGNDGGVGEPFYPNAQVTGGGTLPDSISTKGTYQSKLCFYDENLWAAVDVNSIPPPVNPNWTLDPSRIDVLQMDVEIQGYSDLDGDHIAETLTTDLTGHCVLSSDKTAYKCTTTDLLASKKGL